MYVYINTNTHKHTHIHAHQSTQINFPTLYSRFKESFNGGESFTAEAAIESWKVDLSGLMCVCVCVRVVYTSIYIHKHICIYIYR